jgi:RNA polymerase sigma-32 factor
VEDVARELGVKPETVLEMEARMANHDLAFDGTDTEEEGAPPAPAGYIPDLRMEPSLQLERADSAANEREQLYAALDGLDDRSRTILEARWLSDTKATLQELATQYGVSAERIRQIEKAAMNKIRAQLVM